MICGSLSLSEELRAAMSPDNRGECDHDQCMYYVEFVGKECHLEVSGGFFDPKVPSAVNELA